MAQTFRPGDAVQTRFGKGVVREVRNSGQLFVEVSGRSFVVSASDVSALEGPRRRARAASARAADPPMRPSPPASHRRSSEVDLHGLTTMEAVARAERALNDALLADVAQVRFIHGRSGGRVRAALHRWLRDVPTVRQFRVDQANDGVTIVEL